MRPEHYQQEDVKPYNNQANKTAQVEEMFDHISPTYDRLNALLSLGMDKGWRRKSMQALQGMRLHNVLDVATGTGDFALSLRDVHHAEHIVGVDLSEGMLKVAREKVQARTDSSAFQFMKADVAHLPFPAERFDAVTVAFGVRNFESLDAGLKEIYRVLTPGGRFMALELTAPQRPPMSWGYTFYTSCLLPLIGRLISKDSSAYSYLPRSIRAFTESNAMQKALRAAGFVNIRVETYTLGVCTLYVAEKTAADSQSHYPSRQDAQPV